MSGCVTCGELGERVDADLAAGEALPVAASKLEPIAGGDARRCPTCGACFLYTYEYEYNALGPSWEDASLQRIEPDRVKEVLLGSPPSEAVFQALGQLGSPDGEAAMMTRLRAELEKPRTSYEAVRKLVGLHLGKSDVAAPDVTAIERLLRHARAEVRKDTLYLLQSHRGSLVFRAAAASTDPSPAVRSAAATAAFGASDEVSLVPAIIACLEDPVDVVRSNAAWALAVFAERNEDMTAALPMLEVRLAEESSAKVRTTVERAVDAILAWTPPTRRVHVWRCPKCGSTDAGPDESRSAYEFTFMQCNGCKTGGLVDSWQRDSDWSLAIDIPINATDVPAYVTPLAPGDGFYESMQAAKANASATATPAPKPAATTPPAPPATPTPAPPATPTPAVAGPPTALALGCERCFGADARTAWEAINTSTEASLISDVHFAVDIMACACGQRFAVVFTERVNYRDGGDDLTWLALPISSDEHARVARCGKRSVASVLTEIGVDRRFLVRNQAGGPVDAWWRSSGFSIDPTVPSDPAGPATEPVHAGMPVSWLLASEEVADFWALGVPLEAAHVPDEELRVAIASKRVKRAVFYSSMGTADTYWELAGSSDTLAEVRGDGAVVPGDTAIETPYEDHIDDRDVDKVLWSPFFREQAEALARAIPPASHDIVVAEYARILADLEERWADGPKLDARAPFLAYLRADGPGDAGALERWLGEHGNRSVRHLIDGIRARWLSHDVAQAFHAAIASAERFKDRGETLRATRLELLRCGVRVARART